MNIIESPELIGKYQTKLKSKLYFQANKRPKPILTWPGPNGNLPYEVNYISKLNMWGCYILNPRKTERHWNGFGIREPKIGKSLPIDLTISFPNKEQDRKQGGVFVESENGEVLIYHTGNIYGGVELFWAKYTGKEIQGIYSDGTERKLAYVASLNSKDCLKEIASFVRKVNSIRKK